MMTPTYNPIDVEKSELTLFRHKYFSVEVKRSIHQSSTDFKNRWCVYAYIYDIHPKYKELVAGEYLELSCHSYVSFLKELTITDVLCRCIDFQPPIKQDIFKVGWDYLHYGDERFDVEHSAEVFYDAKRLYEQLSRMCNPE